MRAACGRSRLGALLLPLLCALGCGGRAAPSIVLVTIDTLRADHLSGYGYGKPTTPNLDRMMERGATFTWAFSASSSTAPSHASILTGLDPTEHSVGGFNGHTPLGTGFDTLAELLARQGYRTAAVVSNPVLRRSLGLDQGFEVYDDHMGSQELHRAAAERHAADAVDRALELLDGLRGSSFFLWLHLQDPHGPYDPPTRALDRIPDASGEERTLPVGLDYSGYQAIPSYQAFGEERAVRQYVRRYDGEIAFADAELGRLFDYLDGHEDLADALVIVTADHGEALGEDGFYFAHSHSLGLDQVHVPLVIVGPGVRPGVREARAVSNTWIFDTVLRFADAAGPGGADRSVRSDRVGRDLLEPARGRSGWQPGPVYMTSLGQVAVARGDRFARRDLHPARATKFWAAPNPNSGSFWKPLGQERLALGPAGDDAPDPSLGRLLERHRQAMLGWRQRFAGGRGAAPLSPERREALRALGYVR